MREARPRARGASSTAREGPERKPLRPLPAFPPAEGGRGRAHGRFAGGRFRRGSAPRLFVRGSPIRMPPGHPEFCPLRPQQGRGEASGGGCTPGMGAVLLRSAPCFLRVPRSGARAASPGWFPAFQCGAALTRPDRPRADSATAPGVVGKRLPSARALRVRLPSRPPHRPRRAEGRPHRGGGERTLLRGVGAGAARSRAHRRVRRRQSGRAPAPKPFGEASAAAPTRVQEGRRPPSARGRGCALGLPPRPWDAAAVRPQRGGRNEAAARRRAEQPLPRCDTGGCAGDVPGAAVPRDHPLSVARGQGSGHGRAVDAGAGRCRLRRPRRKRGPAAPGGRGRAGVLPGRYSAAASAVSAVSAEAASSPFFLVTRRFFTGRE